MTAQTLLQHPIKIRKSKSLAMAMVKVRERKLIVIKLQEFSMNLAEKKYLKDSCVCI